MPVLVLVVLWNAGEIFPMHMYHQFACGFQNSGLGLHLWTYV